MTIHGHCHLCILFFYCLRNSRVCILQFFVSGATIPSPPQRIQAGAPDSISLLPRSLLVRFSQIIDSFVRLQAIKGLIGKLTKFYFTDSFERGAIVAVNSPTIRRKDPKGPFFFWTS
ncbi:hypothetical protein F9C07_5202 [Aspergillus flavus]|uniref:Uncharacterized protein n=1 Tax=Aspergillus flavus (strain ATCC 200026 / FGSC A1120 / IAM 13836 / NRRL 3357 / JCM 12722 / SRRC 167) TaxID=332952 RepID=A0A7U2MWH4_ASPFN|nr:hypothetical protein F9C07_5202 [Aspergillus flavus]